MAKLSHSDSRRMYSWWWDSHISPKNSKWLQENLTDMDSKVKVMIKLLEQDADSFAKRADMYYKQRPELMKLVEDFYRAYRALAERYDHATGVIRHAHRTMSEAFPNQVPLMFGDDSPANSGTGTPEMQNGEFTDDDPVARRKVLKQVNDSFRSVERVRKGLNFDDADEKEHSMKTNHVEDRQLSKSDNGSKSEDVLALKEALAKLEAEKEAGLAQYQQSLDRISKLEAEISRTNEDFKMLTDHATKADSEVVVLKESLSKLETEKESKLQDYLQSLEKISGLQEILSTSQEDAKKLDERASLAETEAESLREQLDKLTVEKDEALSNYMETLQLISNLENKLLLTEEDARKLKERAENAESEVDILKKTIFKLTAEKEASALQYQQCLERISSLEHQLATAEKEAERLNMEIDNEMSKLKGAEEQCSLLQKTNESLHSELELLMLKMGTQTHELTEKQKEVGKLLSCVHEERLRFVEAETAFQTLQHLHAQTQEELRSMASELQKRAQLMNIMETRSQSLQDEVLKVKEENKQLDEVNTSSALSIKDLQNEISCLRESKGALEVEAELRLDQRNALQQEIYCLKEELNDMNKKHVSVLDQVHAVGLNPESLGSSVKELQEENSKIRETCQRESSEKAALLAKLEILEQLLEKNSILENTLSDLNAELEAMRGKIEILEQSCQSLLKEKTSLVDEKATLMIQLQETNENLEKLSENNNFLENSLSDANRQLEALKAKSKSLEDSCQFLVNEKASLISEKDGLTSELEKTQIRLEDLGKVYEELEGRCMNLEKEKESTLQKVEELQMSLSAERQERASYIQMSETLFTGVEGEMHALREESERRKIELDQVIDDVVDSEIEIFVLRRTAQDLAQVNSFIILEKQKLLEECSLSGKKISQLEKNNFQQEVEIKTLADQAGSLRVGTIQLLEALNIVADDACKDKIEKDMVCFNQMLNKLQSMKESLYDADEENMQQSVELSVLVAWIKQLRIDLQDLELEKNNVEHDNKVKTVQLLALQSEVLTVLDLNEELKLKLREEDCNKESLMSKIEDLNKELKDMQGTCLVLQREKFEISEEKRSLMNNLLQLEEKNNVLEEENCVLCGKVLALDNHSLIFRSVAEEKFMGLKRLGEDLNKLQDINAALMGKLSLTETKLEESESDNLQLQERLQKSEDELKEVTTIKDRLSDEIEKGKEVLRQMELELQEAERKMNLVEEEKFESNRSVEDLKMVRDSHENQILKLSEENNCLRGASQSLEVELHKLHGENNKRKIQEENLQCEMQRKINEINRLEIEAASVFGEFQFSMVSQLLYEQKFHELQGECLGFIHQNEDLKTQLAAFGPEIVALKESISSLENHTDIHIKFQNPESEEVQGTQLTNDTRLNEDKREPRARTFSDLRDLRKRLQAIEKAAVDTKELMVQENTNLRFKLDAAMKQLESSSRSESGRYRRNLKQKSEITEADGALLTKDIMLDQVSDGSSRDLSKRQPVDTNNQIVELWETTDPENTIGFSVSKSKNLHRVKSLKKQKSGVPTSEKDLSVDKLEVSKRFNGGADQEGNKRKVLERLDSDVQKLANLQITVQDLKRKLGVVEKDKRGKAVIECEALKGKLEEADTAILKLFDLNGKLMKNVENNSPFPEVWSSFDLEGDGSARRMRVSGQAAKMSEKIGRLQLEIQKLQFILLKFDGEKEGKTKVVETKRRVLLRDYLYGGGRKGQTRKKTHFCACVQPSTVED